MGMKWSLLEPRRQALWSLEDHDSRKSDLNFIYTGGLWFALIWLSLCPGFFSSWNKKVCNLFCRILQLRNLKEILEFQRNFGYFRETMNILETLDFLNFKCLGTKL